MSHRPAARQAFRLGYSPRIVLALAPGALHASPAGGGAEEARPRRTGTGVASAELLPGVRLVRAFNAIDYEGDDGEALRVATWAPPSTRSSSRPTSSGPAAGCERRIGRPEP